MDDFCQEKKREIAIVETFINRFNFKLLFISRIFDKKINNWNVGGFLLSSVSNLTIRQN